MVAGASAVFAWPATARAAEPGERPPPVGGEVDAGAVRFSYVSEVVEKPGAHGLFAVKNEVRNTGPAGLHFSWEKAGLVHFPRPLPAGAQANAWPSAPGASVRVDSDAPLLFDGEPKRAEAQAYVPVPAGPVHARRPAAPRSPAPGSTRIASSIELPNGGLVGFDAEVAIGVDGQSVRYSANLSPASFSLALGGVVELLGDEGLAVRVAAEQGYKARVSSFEAMLPEDGAKPPANWLRDLSILSGRLLTIEPDATRDGQIGLTFRTKFRTFQAVERAFVVLGPTGEPVVAGIVMGLTIPRG
ncbi:hypothetical protein GCM10009416_39610 [Craurococcus roseus]|uniref:DUF3108 domain-containing protein n=1 Tax=Craurococcus roseus TaxID=77585 RepID=A0ABN1FTC9_9PROT